MYHCTQCGDDVESLNEGICEECHQQNHEEFLRNQFERERWQKLSDRQRDNEIRSAKGC